MYQAIASIRANLNDVKMFHTDRGKEFDNKLISESLETFGIQRSLSMKGCPTTLWLKRRLRYFKQNSLTELISLLLNSSLLNLMITFIGSVTFEFTEH